MVYAPELHQRAQPSTPRSTLRLPSSSARNLSAFRSGPLFVLFVLLNLLTSYASWSSLISVFPLQPVRDKESLCPDPSTDACHGSWREVNGSCIYQDLHAYLLCLCVLRIIEHRPRVCSWTFPLRRAEISNKTKGVYITNLYDLQPHLHYTNSSSQAPASPQSKSKPRISYPSPRTRIPRTSPHTSTSGEATGEHPRSAHWRNLLNTL